MARRTGVPALRHVAHELCRLIVKFTPVIQSVFPENTAILTALAAANAACSALDEQLAELQEVGV
jgi:hypothetical protein